MTTDAPFRGRTAWLLPLCGLIITIILFECTSLDVLIQDCFYSRESGWLITFDKKSPVVFLYYTLPKILIGLFGAFLVFSIAHTAIRQHRPDWLHIYLLACLITIPSVVALIKARSNMPYPCKIERYGGDHPIHNLKQAFLTPLPHGAKRYKGWPGGHASGGFALLGLAFIATTRRRRWRNFALVTLLGSFMGLGHTLDGNHFISHSFVTFFLAWLIAALIFQLFSSHLHTPPSTQGTNT